MDIENLRALVYGWTLTAYQKVLAQKEFEALTDKPELTKNKFAYENMLNRIRDSKISKTKTPQFTNESIEAWNNAIELCHHIVKSRRSKFEVI